MKSNLLLTLTLALGATLGASAVQPEIRVTSSAHGSAKQFNTQGHAALVKSMPRRAAEDAPANAVEVPFTHDLGKGGSEVVNYTAINVNNDNRKWQYHSASGYAACMSPNQEGIDANDDWLLTVPIHLAAGDYVVSYEVGIMGSGTPKVQFETWLFKSPDLDGKLAEIAPSTVQDSKDNKKYEYNCAIPSEGYYYIGVHCTTTSGQKGTMKLANLGMRAGSVTPPVFVDPPAAGTLTYELAPKGELKATVTYTAPTKTKSGADLESISKVLITSRWEVDKFTFENVTPGQTIVQEVEMYAGYNNRFTAEAYTGDVAGEKVEIKNIFCGPDTPLAPANVTLTVNEGYETATLSWEAPGEVGENGGYVDPEALEFYIFDAFGTYYDPALYTTDKTYVTIDYSETDGQDFYAYQVTAGYGDNYSLDSSSDIVVAGKPDGIPFEESFAGGVYDGFWAISTATTSNTQQQWGTITDDYFSSLIDPDDPDAPTPLKSHDGDKGFYYWLPMDAGSVFGLNSIRTDISTAANPVLEFWYQGQGSKFDIYVAPGTEPAKLVHTIDLKDNPTTGWTLARIPLSDYKSQGAVTFEIRLSAVHNTDDRIFSVPFDNIRIIDLAANDLHIVHHNLPAKLKPLDTLSCVAHVENRGTEAAQGAVAVLNVNGKEVGTVDLAPIAPGEFADAEFSYTVPLNIPATFDASIVLNLESEATPADNKTNANIEVIRNSFATVTDLSATVSDGKVLLEWSEPVNGASVPEVVSEDFESSEYTPMSISGAGEWTVYDGDKQKTYNVFRELFNPYQTQPMAFQLFNIIEAQVPDSYMADAQAHSGNTYMLAPSAQSSENDNWLISPLLSGKTQTVTFWAKSYTVTWPETMEVYYSTTDNQYTSFTVKVDIQGEFSADGSVPEVWTKYTVDLPEGATYFAIRHTSYDTLALFVDDVTFEAQPAVPEDLAVEGYHLFRDGEQITDELLKECSYTDSPIADDAAAGNYTFTYTVVPVYNHGAVLESNAAQAMLAVSGLEQVAIGTLKTDTKVYNLQGMRLQHPQLTPGVYIIVEGDNARKVQLH